MSPHASITVTLYSFVSLKSCSINLGRSNMACFSAAAAIISCIHEIIVQNDTQHLLQNTSELSLTAPCGNNRISVLLQLLLKTYGCMLWRWNTPREGVLAYSWYKYAEAANGDRLTLTLIPVKSKSSHTCTPTPITEGNWWGVVSLIEID